MSDIPNASPPRSAELRFTPAAHYAYGFPGARLLESIASAYQRIDVWETALLGRLFTLDGRPMTSVGDEFIYHECMVHPAALAQPDPARVLILGGGDGGAARQWLKHPGVRQVVIAELDAAVIEVARRHLAAVHGGALDDPRVEIVIGDAADFVAQHCARLEPCAPAGATERRGWQPPTRPFDAVVFDLTPPDSPASSLYAPAFYRQLRRLMAPGATLSMHLGAALFEPQRIAALTTDLRAEFRFVSTLSAFVPLYGTQWRFAIASDVHDVARAAPALLTARAAERGIQGLRYYSPEVHDAFFRIGIDALHGST